MDKREFLEKYRYEGKPIDITKYREEVMKQPMQRNEERAKNYTAPKGTAKRAKSRKKKTNTRLAALILAGIIGIGGISLINNNKMNYEDLISISEMQQQGHNPQDLGLSQETIELFEKYDEYFENFDKHDALTEDQVVDMINEINQMHFFTVKEKIGSLVGANSQNIKMYYDFDKSDGAVHASVVINKDGYNGETYSSDNNWILPNKNTISSELVDIITQLENLDNLKYDVKKDKITKANAVKKLEKYYRELEQVATGEFIKDEKGNISIIHYESKQGNRQQDENERDD